MTEWFTHWTRDREVAGSNPGLGGIFPPSHPLLLLLGWWTECLVLRKTNKQGSVFYRLSHVKDPTAAGKRPGRLLVE